WSDKSCRWEIFVGTNRGLWDDATGTPNANRVLDHPQYGRAEVTIPRKPRDKTASLPGLPWRKNRDGDQPATTVDSGPLSSAEFLTGVCDQLERSRQGDLLLFVHGFNVRFDEAVICAAQLALKMPFNGAVVTYAWPTQGGVFNYDEDEPINKASVAPFMEFLQTLRAGIPAQTRITILVHSMGNRIVMDALDQMPSPSGEKPISQVVLCAPDVGRKDFERWAPGVLDQSERVALYSNASDSALIVSKGKHAESRAGDAWHPVLVPGIEVVDCSRVDLTMMGHSYFGENEDVQTDLFMLIKEQRSADKRPHLERRENETGATYWSFQHSAPAIYCTWHFDERE
ncbi:MAG: alpha/beta hydrolase, partial [Planctomycetaceae bacterium]|nr:alpha/beta hydrolase [Planctomycetaceae bacterium]